MEQKVALVTGASRDIGQAIVERLAQDGFAVVVNYARSADKAQEVVDRIQQRGGKAIAVAGDVSSNAHVEALFSKTIEQFGRVDVVVNNAGIAGGGPLEAITDEQYNSIFDTNVKGTIYTTQEAVRHFGEGSAGSIAGRNY